MYTDNSFVSLTYNDENLPLNSKGVGTLDYSHVQAWLKRLRFAFSTYQKRARLNDVKSLRFFCVGEYGDKSWRPHYHAILFNFPTCLHGLSRYSKMRQDCCIWCDMVRDTWTHGHVFLGNVGQSSAGYVAGYVNKKMTRTDDRRLDGRWPEFARQSLKPGIGAPAMRAYADQLMRLGLIGPGIDVPAGIRVGKYIAPLGRYLRSQLRQECNIDKPENALAESQAYLQPLREASWNDEVQAPSIKTFKRLVVAAAQGKIDSMYSHDRRFKKSGALT